ncbi:MAG: tetratricopeptide repeat protein [Candidatus Aminicenantales bacterium]
MKFDPLLAKSFRPRAFLLGLPAVLFFSFFSACASRPPKTSPDPNQVIAGPQHYFEAGEYQKAIGAYDQAYRRHPKLKGLLAAYIDCLEKIKLEADAVSKREDYRKAEKMYELLLENFPLFEDFRMALPFSREGLNERIKSCRVGAARLQAGRALQAENFSLALDSVKRLLETYPNDPESLAELAQISFEIRQKASQALAQEEYAIAGRAFFALSQNMDSIEKISLLFPLTRSSLEEGIKTCRAHLTKRGLELYRKRKLAEAISVWKELLTFDPKNVEIQKAIDTATEQLKKLKEK